MNRLLRYGLFPQLSPRARRGVLLGALVCLLAGSPGCSVKRLAINQLGDALSNGGGSFATDDDPDLIRDAAPFSLKLMEALLAEAPRHVELLQALASGFTQYSFAFADQPADELEDKDLAAAAVGHARAKRLYDRARNYGLRGLRYVVLILVPAALPAILSGLKIGWAFAWRTLIAAELVFGASSGKGGLGWYIFQNRNELYTDRVFAGLALVVLAVVGLSVS